MTRLAFLVGVLLGLFGCASQTERRPPISIQPEKIAANVLLGEAYPSGNVYLKAFIESASFGLPTTVSFQAVPRLTCSWRSRAICEERVAREAPGPYTATFVEGARSDFLEIEEKSMGIESPNDRDDLDFFSYIDSPDDRGVMKYASRPIIPSAFAVIAFGSDINVQNIRYSAPDQLRPLTAAEELEVAKRKKEMEEEGKQQKCTTNPFFLDSAEKLLSFEIKSTRYSGLISYYADAGCLGHLHDIYILDVLENRKLLRRFELRHYQGVV